MLISLVALVAVTLTVAWIAFRLGKLRALAKWYFDEEAPVPARALPFLLLLGALLALAGLAMLLAVTAEGTILRIGLTVLVVVISCVFFLGGIALVTYLPPWLKPRWLLDEEQIRWRGAPEVGAD